VLLFVTTFTMRALASVVQAPAPNLKKVTTTPLTPTQICAAAS
jgi:hypothetical protein